MHFCCKSHKPDMETNVFMLKASDSDAPLPLLVASINFVTAPLVMK